MTYPTDDQVEAAAQALWIETGPARPWHVQEDSIKRWWLKYAHAGLEAAERVRATFQNRVQPWMLECFGPEIAADQTERNHRFLEESLELVQACGCTVSEAHQLVDYVFCRPIGEKNQEVGGVMVTMAALCLAQGLDMHDAGETELARIWTKVEQIRAKQAAKPKHSPLPIAEHARENHIGEADEMVRGEQAEADRRDAERYRFIRSPSSPVQALIHGIDRGLAGEYMDAAIDAAMCSADKPQEGGK